MKKKAGLKQDIHHISNKQPSGCEYSLFSDGLVNFVLFIFSGANEWALFRMYVN